MPIIKVFMENFEFFLNNFQSTFHLKNKKEIAEFLKIQPNVLSGWISRNSIGAFLEQIIEIRGVESLKIFVENLPSTDSQKAEKIFHDLLYKFDNSAQAANFAKKLFFYSNGNKRLAFAFDELLDKLRDEADSSIRKQIGQLVSKGLTIFTRLSSPVQLDIIREFVDDLDDATLLWIYNNKNVFRQIVEKEFGGTDLYINRIVN